MVELIRPKIVFDTILNRTMHPFEKNKRTTCSSTRGIHAQEKNTSIGLYGSLLSESRLSHISLLILFCDALKADLIANIFPRITLVMIREQSWFHSDTKLSYKELISSSLSKLSNSLVLSKPTLDNVKHMLG